MRCFDACEKYQVIDRSMYFLTKTMKNQSNCRLLQTMRLCVVSCFKPQTRARNFIAVVVVVIVSLHITRDNYPFIVYCVLLFFCFRSPSLSVHVGMQYKFPQHFSTDAKDLVRNLVQSDLTRRYGNLKNGPNDIKNHRWFAHISWLTIFHREVSSNQNQLFPHRLHLISTTW